MAAVAAGYRMGLIGAGWPVLLLSCTNGHRKRSFHLVVDMHSLGISEAASRKRQLL